MVTSSYSLATILLSLFKTPFVPELHHEQSDQGVILQIENKMEEEFSDGDERSAGVFCVKGGLFPTEEMDLPRPTRATFVQ